MVFVPTLVFGNYPQQIQLIDAATDACLEKPENTSTIGMRLCIVEGLSAADDVLNALYQSVTAELKKPSTDEYTEKYNKETLARLVAAQRAWIAFRDANSELNGVQMLGGTGEPIMVDGKLFSMTKDRVLELNDILVGSF